MTANGNIPAIWSSDTEVCNARCNLPYKATAR